MKKRLIITASVLAVLGILVAQKIMAIPSISNPLTGQAIKTGSKLMNNKILGAHLNSKYGDFTGEPGYWTRSNGDTKVFIITDDYHNRMRVMAPVRKVSKEDRELVYTCLNANFDKALDVRYAINDGVLWSAFLHPLASLTEDELDNAIAQVETLVKNTGTSFTSSSLVFSGSEQNDDLDDVKSNGNGSKK